MNVRTRKKLIPEHCVVALLASVELDNGRVLPPGAEGVVVGLWQNGAAYEVEFTEPFHAVATVGSDTLSFRGLAERGARNP